DLWFDWLLGKWCDSFAAIGPYLVTKDEAGDPSTLEMALTVNGELRQHSDAGEMIFSIPEAVAFLSRFVTLRPGDLICMGTPGGVGAATGAGPGAGTGARAGTDMGSGAGAFEAGAAEAGVTARAGVAVGAGRSRSGATWSVGRDCAKAAPDRPSRSSGIRRMRVVGSMRIEPLPSFAMRVRPPEPPY
ncbi:MAG TPA: fumarylacetoacetate hydrolase family protein, partial [Thauera aminoaromatica]|nr:fumarylacetoacetate hydrolase family protein [Thauera aminoaromatica]